MLTKEALIKFAAFIMIPIQFSCKIWKSDPKKEKKKKKK